MGEQSDLFGPPPAVPQPALPPVVLPRELVMLYWTLGWDGLLTLLHHYGGVSIYIPRQMHPDHPLAQTLGLEVATALCRLGSGHFQVPTGRRLRSHLRDRQIRAARAQGFSLRALARCFRLSERQISKVLMDGKPRNPT